MKISRTEGKVKLMPENFEEVLELSIKLIPGFQFKGFYDEVCREIRIPTETELPEKTFARSGDVYVFRYNGEVYLHRPLSYDRRYECPFLHNEQVGYIPKYGKLLEVHCPLVPMANGEKFASPSLQVIWEQLELFAAFS